MNAKRISGLFVAALAVVLLMAGCAPSRLQRGAFQARTIAATAAYTPTLIVDHPLLIPRLRYHAMGFVRDERDAVERLQTVFRDAAKRVDVSERVVADLLVVGARELGAVITPDPATADYVLDFRVYDYGLSLRSIRSNVSFFIDAEILVREQATQEIVWAKRLHRTSRVGIYHTELSGARLADFAAADAALVLEDAAVFFTERLREVLLKDIVKDKPAS